MLYAAPDRTGKISKFTFDAYAALEANPSQSKYPLRTLSEYLRASPQSNKTKFWKQKFSGILHAWSRRRSLIRLHPPNLPFRRRHRQLPVRIASHFRQRFKATLCFLLHLPPRRLDRLCSYVFGCKRHLMPSTSAQLFLCTPMRLVGLFRSL